MSSEASNAKPSTKEDTKQYWYPDRSATLDEVRVGYQLQERMQELSLVVAIPLLAIFVAQFAMTQTNMLMLMHSIVSSLKALQAQDESVISFVRCVRRLNEVHCFEKVRVLAIGIAGRRRRVVGRLGDAVLRVKEAARLFG
jgi:hypothetical protein